jgi:hypothetical protein
MVQSAAREVHFLLTDRFICDRRQMVTLLLSGIYMVELTL